MDQRVPFFSAAAVNPVAKARASLDRVIARQWYVLGEEVAAFEHAFAAYCGAAACVALANGTDALELALRASCVGRGDTVVLAANAGFYGSTAVRLVGAEPCYADVDEQSLCISTAAVAQALKQGPVKAVIATHLYGQLADIEAIASLCQSHDAVLIEDCAQAHGATRNGSKAGSFADIGCFSFYPTKNLGALGDGGAVTCRDEEIADRVRALRQYGWDRKYHNAIGGGRNSRLDELQAAVLNDKLPGLDAANEQRREVARFYQQALAGLALALPPSCGDDFVAHLYVVRSRQRDALRDFLAARGIETAVHYPVPDHRQLAWPMPAVSLPATEAACESVLSLPCYPGLPRAHQELVAAAVNEFFRAVA